MWEKGSRGGDLKKIQNKRVRKRETERVRVKSKMWREGRGRGGEREIRKGEVRESKKNGKIGEEVETQGKEGEKKKETECKGGKKRYKEWWGKRKENERETERERKRKVPSTHLICRFCHREQRTETNKHTHTQNGKG